MRGHDGRCQLSKNSIARTQIIKKIQLIDMNLKLQSLVYTLMSFRDIKSEFSSDIFYSKFVSLFKPKPKKFESEICVFFFIYKHPNGTK